MHGPGKLVAVKVYKKSGVLQWVLIIVTRNRFFKYIIMIFSHDIFLHASQMKMAR